MKKVTYSGQLDLSKEVISNLTEAQLQEIEGGMAALDYESCKKDSCNGTTVILVPPTAE